MDFFIGHIPKYFSDAISPVLLPYSSYLVNSYTISPPNAIFANPAEGVALTHFWTSVNAGVNNKVTGLEFPSFIRIFGTLVQSVSVEYILVFFDYLAPLALDDSGSDYVSCNSTNEENMLYSRI